MVRRRGDDPRSDRALIATCNEGDPVEAAQAFDVLYRRHKDFVLRVAKRFVPDTDSALDVLQRRSSTCYDGFRPPEPALTSPPN